MDVVKLLLDIARTVLLGLILVVLAYSSCVQTASFESRSASTRSAR